MITYNPAFDLYHCIFRMAHIVQRLDNGESFPIDKVRIWDFYLLFPTKLYNIHLKRSEEGIRKQLHRFINIQRNPYEYRGDNRKLFEWIKQFQISALSCLVSCGILDKNEYLNDNVLVKDHDALDKFVKESGDLTDTEKNVLSFLSLLSKNMPLTGTYGLKYRTELLEYKYDAE